MVGDTKELVQDRQERQEFCRWVKSLTREELVQGMQFTVEEGQDYRLLLEMIRLESPPPTPVHPCAMGYRPRMSERGAQLDYPQGARVVKRTRPQLFQWTDRQPLRLRGKQKEPRFDVIARRKVASWGEIYSVGCTSEQRDADRTLVDQTFVCISNDAIGERSVIFRGDQTRKKILRILQVASRGHLYQSPGRSGFPFCSAWLQPTERWFSLSFYVASRYHEALWGIFTGTKAGGLVLGKSWEDHVLERAIPEAIRMGSQEALRLDLHNVGKLRDGLFWEIFDDQELSAFSSNTTYGQDWQSIWQALRHVRLRNLGESYFDLKVLISNELCKTIAAEMERQLMAESSPTTEPHKRSSSDRKKISSRKKKRTRKKIEVSVETFARVTEQNETGSSPQAESMEPCSLSVSFPDNDTPRAERHQNIILSLTILEDIVEAIFVKAGLEPTPPFVPDPPKETSNLRRKGNETILIRPKDLKRIEVHPALAPTTPLIEEAVDRPIPRGGMFAPSAFTPSHLAGSATWPLQSHDSDFKPFQPIMPPPPQPTLPRDFYQPILDDFLRAKVGLDEEIDGLSLLNRFQLRDRSILSDFFRNQNQSSRIDEDEDEKLMTASTAASVASSTYKDPAVLAEVDDIDKIPPTSHIEPPRLIATIEENVKDSGDIEEEEEDPEVVHIVSAILESPINESCAPREFGDQPASTPSPCTDLFSIELIAPRSPSPQAPLTPPPTLSPILVSLADLREFKRGFSLTPERKNHEVMETRSYSAAAAGSLSNSPIPVKTKGLRTSLSRDDLRIHTFRDDQIMKLRRRTLRTQRSTSDLQPSYRAAVIKSLAKPIASSKSVGLDFRSQVIASANREVPRDSCARSETALDIHREDLNWQSELRKSEDFEIRSTTKDETTTITSALSPNREPEEISNLREERNSYRDMCLTLGAEVAKLKAILGAQQATTVAQPAFEYGAPFGHPMHQPASFDPNGMQPFFYGNKRGQRLGPMSDAGVVRGGDHESQFSEDDKTKTEVVRLIPSGVTVIGSDASIDFNNSISAFGPVNSVPVYDTMHMNGLQSRLTKDILRFLDNMDTQLRRQEKTRRTAVERFSRLVKTIWPRAQVKLYGSHVSGLCLPSSDLDFVVCLPAVHKNAPALAPGVLEGRNAINETSQKLLARELKGESWVDPRSIKLIERTVVPVIKVSTKDTRARVVQLDISFDSPEHHGLEANDMVTQIMGELPLIRPLMLILKQFLLDRGLLTAYTGGISSYCLFLILARYLQEQTQSISDYGSLLMGFLDFHGNHFDPRATGISVRTRQYFVRPNDYNLGIYSAQVQTQPQVWTPSLPLPSPQHTAASSPVSVGPNDFRRRHSLSSDTGSVDGRRGTRPPRFQNGAPVRFQTRKSVPAPGSSTGNNNQDNNLGHGRPFTFDPLFVEDPLSSGNNVGRNAFRIFQVQRAFSDAHRALVASLEWDIHSGELNEGFDFYPLLKCLLQSEDTLYEL